MRTRLVVLLVACGLLLMGCKGLRDEGRSVKHFIETYVTIKGIEAEVTPASDSIHLSVYGVLDQVYSETDRDSTQFLRYSRAKGDTAYKWILRKYNDPLGESLGPDIEGLKVMAASSYSDSLPKDSDLHGVTTITYTSYDDHIYHGYFYPRIAPPGPWDEYCQMVKKSLPLGEFKGVRLPRLKHFVRESPPLCELRLSPPPTEHPARVRIELLLDSGRMHSVEVEIP